MKWLFLCFMNWIEVRALWMKFMILTLFCHDMIMLIDYIRNDWSLNYNIISICSIVGFSVLCDLCNETRKLLSNTYEKDDGTQQTKRAGVNWFSKQNEFLKPESQKNFFCTDRITKLFINRTQSILNQSTLCTRSFIRVLSFTKIYLKPFWKLINTWIRDKDQIKRRNTTLFYTGSLSITREANLVI